MHFKNTGLMPAVFSPLGSPAATLCHALCEPAKGRLWFVGYPQRCTNAVFAPVRSLQADYPADERAALASTSSRTGFRVTCGELQGLLLYPKNPVPEKRVEVGGGPCCLQQPVQQPVAIRDSLL